MRQRVNNEAVCIVLSRRREHTAKVRTVCAEEGETQQKMQQPHAGGEGKEEEGEKTHCEHTCFLDRTFPVRIFMYLAISSFRPYILPSSVNMIFRRPQGGYIANASSNASSIS